MNEYVKPEQAAHYLYRELKSAITGEGWQSSKIAFH
jgi:hypothetical protein